MVISMQDIFKYNKWNKLPLPPCLARRQLGKKFDSAANLSKRPGSVWNCLWGHAL